MYAKVNIKVLNHSRLKEQYPVTEHVPNFAFLTGCHEFKRRDERSWKNPFASCLGEFDTTLKHLRITEQWYIVPVKFRFWRNRELLALLSLHLAEGPREGKCFDTDWRLISPASFYTCSDNLEKRNGNNKDYVRKKPSRHGCDWGDFVLEVSWNKMGCNDVLVTFWLNLLTVDKIKK